jgi:hypothetical protein
LKLKHLGFQYAREKEIKGKELLKPYVLKLEAKGILSKNLALASDLLDYIVGLRFSGSALVKPYWNKLKPAIYRWPTVAGKMGSGLKVLRGK